ncbi:hypothetical protein AV530_016302 [Patagioenas fasciata monilis]|uniref:Uncharacterized protein n=1 Tax=Patagioenas fasciata monilis TaxID=372326 RepID=A0A1V4JYC7_PATFA|nr:hypothetical protein AV530_016302 [Patagioenas fasciata monilis]
MKQGPETCSTDCRHFVDGRWEKPELTQSLKSSGLLPVRNSISRSSPDRPMEKGNFNNWGHHIPAMPLYSPRL